MVRVFVTEDGVGDFDTGVGAMERKKSGSSTARSPRSPLASDAQAGHAGFARKMAEKVRNGISGNGGGSSSRSTSSASSGPMRFTKSGVIDEDDIILEGSKSSRSHAANARGTPRGTIVSGITKKGASFVKKIVDRTHLSDLKDTIRSRTMPTRRTASSSREGLMRSDSNESSGGFGFFTASRRMFSTGSNAGDGAPDGLERRDSNPWVCFGGFESDFDGDQQFYHEEEEEEYVDAAVQPLSDVHEYENLIEVLQREVTVSRERMAAMEDELARQAESKSALQEREKRGAREDANLRSALVETQEQNSRLRSENERLRAELLQQQKAQRAEVGGGGGSASSDAEQEKLRKRVSALEAELQQMTAVAKESTDRAEHLELQIGIYKNVMRKDINSIGASLAQYGMPEETCFHDKDVGNLIATAVEDVHKYLVQLRSNNTKAKQRSALRQFQSKYHPDKNPILTNLFEEIFKIITQEARMMGMDI